MFLRALRLLQSSVPGKIRGGVIGGVVAFRFRFKSWQNWLVKKSWKQEIKLIVNKNFGSSKEL